MQAFIGENNARMRDLWFQFELKLGRSVAARKHLEALEAGKPLCIKLVLAPETDAAHIEEVRNKLAALGWTIRETTTIAVDEFGNELYGFCASKTVPDIFSSPLPAAQVVDQNSCCEQTLLRKRNT